MPLRIKVKVVRIGGSLRMTIPKEVVRELDIKEGEYLLVSLNDSQMIVEKEKA